ncbi:hypothetical protein KL935_000586 [Ogataea polymorpha]|nr:hypothetical protein KL937_002937 [Ogataea polymorpha]KAG7893143.1 hypothetical protein KL936_001317 [Ogataea polymorpha]KAG7897139.1 hypothetical protein KL908_000541 [Ogataea polymorpha]KAG7903054.1 hypothetical protein KL935_000586 [Ogataea polymorpha]KAG7912339.1 hypothetical protein KL906_000543 [Ogataea polymorpha]
MISASYGVLCSVVLSLIGKRNLAQWSTARFYYYLFSTVMRITIEIEGEEKLSGLPAILISNHQSELDVFMLGRIFPKRCVVTAKKQLQLVPFLGWFMTLSGTFFLDRSDREKAIRVLNKALEDLKATSGGLFMFPEGTRSYSSRPTLLPFKKGAFHLAVQAQIPIIPLVVSNTSNIYSLKERNFNTGTIKVKVLEPISTEGLTKDDVNKLVEATYANMEEEIRKIGMSVVAGDVSGESEALLSQEVQ